MTLWLFLNQCSWNAVLDLENFLETNKIQVKVNEKAKTGVFKWNKWHVRYFLYGMCYHIRNRNKQLQMGTARNK